jgi:hypothetical protein
VQRLPRRSMTELPLLTVRGRPVPVQMWEGEPSAGADVGGVSPSPGADVAGVSPSPGADLAKLSVHPHDGRIRAGVRV